MPSTSHTFDSLYTMLLNQTERMPAEAKSPETALFLLIALVSDHLFVKRMIGLVSTRHHAKIDDQSDDNVAPPSINPFPPLSPAVESARIETNILRALDAWYEEFHTICPRTHLAMYYYLRLSISCPELQKLPEIAGYGTPAHREFSRLTRTVIISDESLRLAWLVLDHVDLRNADMESRTAIWTPIILFHAALVVWRRIKATSSQTIGSLKMLQPFISELEHVPWPCSWEMSGTLRRLASGAGESSSSSALLLARGKAVSLRTLNVDSLIAPIANRVTQISVCRAGFQIA